MTASPPIDLLSRDVNTSLISSSDLTPKTLSATPRLLAVLFAIAAYFDAVGMLLFIKTAIDVR